MKNIEAQLFPHQKLTVTSGPIATIHTNDREHIKFEVNVHSQVEKLNNSNINLNEQSNTLRHLFNQKLPTPEQEQDLMNFREVGQREFASRVEYYILRNPSVKPRNCRKRLLTFTAYIERIDKRRCQTLKGNENYRLNVGKNELHLQAVLVHKS